MKRILGLPIKCPTCPPKHYFGVLKGEQLPRERVKLGADKCENCGTKLVPAREPRAAP